MKPSFVFAWPRARMKPIWAHDDNADFVETVMALQNSLFPQTFLLLSTVQIACDIMNTSEMHTVTFSAAWKVFQL